MLIALLAAIACGCKPAARVEVASEPETVQSHFHRGLALHAAGDCAGAEIALDQAVKLQMNNADFSEALIRVRASCAGRIDHATLVLAAELFSGRPEPRFAEAYAMALAAAGRFERAVRLQQRVVAATDEEFSRALLQQFESGHPASDPWPADTTRFSPTPADR